METFTVHALRHFFISWAINRPVNPLQVQAIVGHTDMNMIVQTYFHPDLDGVTGDKMRSMSLVAGAVPEPEQGSRVNEVEVAYLPGMGVARTGTEG